MAQWTLFHNPQCSKSREALSRLEERGLQIRIVEYLQQPPTEDELRALVAKLEGPISALVRTKEELFKESPFDVNSVDEVVRHLSQSPRLIERPIVIKDDQAIIARPVELIEKLFN